jgi:hypothetical protein
MISKSSWWKRRGRIEVLCFQAFVGSVTTSDLAEHIIVGGAEGNLLRFFLSSFLPSFLYPVFRPPYLVHFLIYSSSFFRCVEKMDHHCPWIGRCIGRHNYKAFCLFVGYVTVINLYVFSWTLFCFLVGLLFLPFPLSFLTFSLFSFPPPLTTTFYPFRLDSLSGQKCSEFCC